MRFEVVPNNRNKPVKSFNSLEEAEEYRAKYGGFVVEHLRFDLEEGGD